MSSWHLLLAEHSISPDVQYQTLIVSEIIKNGYLAEPHKYYYAAKLYAEFPATELLASVIKIVAASDPYFIMKYLWIYVKFVWISFLILLYRKIYLLKFNENEVKKEDVVLFSILSSFFAIMSSSSLYFFSFMNHNLMALTLMTIILHLYSKTKFKLETIIVVITLIFSHNLTLIIFIFWNVLLLFFKFFNYKFENNSKLFSIEISFLAMAVAYLAYITSLNLNNFISLLQNLISEYRFHLNLERTGQMVISPVKPFYYRSLGVVHVLISMAGMIYEVILILKEKTRRNALTIWLPFILFSLVYLATVTVAPLLSGIALDILVRARLPMSLIAAIFLTDILLDAFKGNGIWKSLSLVVIFLYLIGGFYDLIPPSVYDKSVQYTMDDVRYFLVMEKQFSVLRCILEKIDETRRIYSIALGYYHIGGYGLPYIRLDLLDFEDNKNKFVAILRWDLDTVPDYSYLTINIYKVFKTKHIIFNSGNIFAVTN
ncbi:MAG: hypothetical protein QXL96_10745 [Ignisphaera sp.]